MFERSECAEEAADRPADDSRRAREAGAETVPEGCDYCGGSIATDEWYPAATRRDGDGDGDVEIYSFCDEECRARWERERADD